MSFGGYSDRNRYRVCAVMACGAALACMAGAARGAASDTPPAAPDDVAASANAPVQYALGLAVVNRPAYAGSGSQQWKLRPLWTVKWGRYRLSGPRSSGLLGRPGDDGSGASAELAEGAQWRLGASLGIDGGRRSSDDPRLAGLPDIPRTLRGKLYANRDLGSGWGISGSVSDDLGRRGGGVLAGLDMGYGRALAPGVRASVGLGVGLADAQAMRSQFGIAPDAGLRAGRAAYVPGACVRDLHLGGTVQWAVSGAWFGFLGAGVTQLQGEAADSPLVARRTSGSLTFGLAWRNLP